MAKERSVSVLSLQIGEVKQFMSALLMQEVFDNFCVAEVQIQMAYSVRLDGRRNTSFYKDEELEAIQVKSYMQWSELKPLVLQVIKGNKTPLSFRIVLLLTEDNTKRVMESTQMQGIRAEDVKGLYLNLNYDHDILCVITGTSLASFTLDKTLEHEWDSYTQKFLKKNGIAFTSC